MPPGLLAQPVGIVIVVSPTRVAAPNGLKGHPSRLSQQVFLGIVVIGLVSVDGAMGWQIKAQQLEGKLIVAAAGCKVKFNHTTVSRCNQMDFIAVEVLPLAGVVAPKGFSFYQAALAGANILTDGQGTGIDGKLSVFGFGLRTYYQRKVAEGKNKMLVLNAI